MPALLVLSTTPTRQEAEKIAHTLVQKKLAACVNIVGPIKSIYRWQGKTEQAEEHLLIIKTTTQAYPALQQEIRKLHSYQLPEIIALPIQHGLPQYIEWIHTETQDREG